MDLPDLNITNNLTCKFWAWIEEKSSPPLEVSLNTPLSFARVRNIVLSMHDDQNPMGK
jgi:hypothetical protein